MLGLTGISHLTGNTKRFYCRQHNAEVLQWVPLPFCYIHCLWLYHNSTIMRYFGIVLSTMIIIRRPLVEQRFILRVRTCLLAHKNVFKETTLIIYSYSNSPRFRLHGKQALQHSCISLGYF